jgi:hypothetical protein
MRWTAIARSTGVRNHAVVGVSGKRNLTKMMKEYNVHYQNMTYQNAKEVINVKIPVIIISLSVLDIELPITDQALYSPLPWLKSLRLREQSAETDEPSDDLG